MAALISSPSTPPSHRTFSAFAHTPSRSSPLTVPADSSPVLSPTPKAHGGRRSQYKSTFQTSPTNDRKRSSTRRVTSNPAPIPDLFGNTEETTGKKLLRDRFRARCLERALKERERKIAGKRRLSDWSSDGPDEMMDFDDDEDEDESMLNDPVRITIYHDDSMVIQLSIRSSFHASWRVQHVNVSTHIVYPTRKTSVRHLTPTWKTQQRGRTS